MSAIVMAISWADAGLFIKDAIEFILIFGVFYWVLCFFRGTRAVNALVGIIIILLALLALSEFAKLEVFSWLLERILFFLPFVMILIFQPELRRLLAQFGGFSRHTSSQQKEILEEIANAVTQMSFRRCGALIVFERKVGMAAIINSAVHLDCEINSLLLQSLFYPNSPLHDGAVIIKDEKIVAAHAILPLSMDAELKNVGTRHRAAIGVTEETDAVAVLVSEETGIISAAYHGELKRDLSEADLLIYLKEKFSDTYPVKNIMNEKNNTEDSEDELK